jgi:hydrogenase expression/formation protein HypE
MGLIIEEGLELTELRRILDALKRAADACEVAVVTGDTKVVRRGQCDGLYINTSGIGERIQEFDLKPERIEPGDRVLASGTLGDHGMAVLSAREGIDIENGPVSDTASVFPLVHAARPWAGQVRFMRDPTRGGAAAVLNEIVEAQPFGIVLREDAIPVSTAARASAELLGLDLLSVACEGRVLLVCAESVAGDLLAAWRRLPEGKDAGVIGEVTGDAGRVILQTSIGGRRLVDVPRGELLPRIC